MVLVVDSAGVSGGMDKESKFKDGVGMEELGRALSVCSLGSEDDGEEGRLAEGRRCQVSKRKDIENEKNISFSSLDLQLSNLSNVSPLCRNSAEEFYNFEDVLGSGMDIVLLATSITTGEQVAVKRTSPDRRIELEILQSVQHPNIVELLGFFERPDAIDIVLEYIEGGDLYNFLARKKAITEQETASIIAQLLSALCYLHERGIIHFDVKLENVLVKETSSGAIQVKLTDFGISEVVWGLGDEKHTKAGELAQLQPSEALCGVEALRKKRLRSILGTSGYIAPELRRFQKSDKVIDPIGAPVDIYSCGIILYILLTGNFPEEMEDPCRQMDLDGLDYPKWHPMAKEGLSLLKRMLEPNPKERVTAKEALRDPWLARTRGKTVTSTPPLK